MTWAALYLVLTLATAFWLRHRWAWAQRLNDMNWQALVLADIAVAFGIFWPLYLVGIMRDRPLAWATISATCAFYAGQGRAWARAGARAIDWLFLALTSQREHCADALRRWASPLAAL